MRPMQVSSGHAIFPGRRTHNMTIVTQIEKRAPLGEVERDETVNGCLDRLFFQAGNDSSGVFVVSEPDDVRVYTRVREGFKRVV